MNVSQQNTDNLNAVINIEITKADYEGNVDKSLRSYRQKATIPGFRKGMVPLSMIKKMFGKSVMVEEINKLVSDQLMNYIRENKLNILGEPLSSETQQPIDFDTQSDFIFAFDIALAPEINIPLTKEDCVDYYELKVDDEMVQKQVEALTSRYGSHDKVDVAGEKDMIKGKSVQLDEAGNVKEDGIVVDNMVISPAYVKNDAQKAKFAGVKVGDKIVFNPSESCDGNETELVAMLHISKEDVANAKGDFEIEVIEITTFKPAEMNQQLFDNVFGAGKVTTEEEFMVKVREMIADQLTVESDYKFGVDARVAVEKKVGEVVLPEAFLKRWILATQESKTVESVEEEFPKMKPELVWHLIKEQIVRNFEIKVSDDDLLDMAKQLTKAQFAQYGMMNIPDDILENYSKDMIKNKDSVRSLADRATETKITKTIKEAVTLNTIESTVEDFYKKFEN